MLFICRKHLVSGMSSHPGVRCLLPSVDTARRQPSADSVHKPTISFRVNDPNPRTIQIPHTAGGSYGDEFRPD
jgi:hypothetical protein